MDGFKIFSMIPTMAILLIVLSHVEAHSRPEYALKTAQNRCTACHYSPAGGGPKNLNGKYYGAGGSYQLAPMSRQEWAGADIRMLYYAPEKHSDTKGGMGVMDVNIFGSLPLLPQTAEGQETRLVAEHNLGGFGSGPRQLYVRWQLRNEIVHSLAPQFILVGRIIPAFGLMTDEHRTYVRMQTATTWNQDFETGLMLSGNPVEALHYDLALVNGQKNSGQSLSQGNATLWGGLLNVRIFNGALPFFLGASGAYHEHESGKKSPYAWSGYGALDLGRLTGQTLRIQVLAEYAKAKNWNDRFTALLVTDTTYASSVSESSSEGLMTQVTWDVGTKWTLNYKYDRLMLDRDFPGDIYQRHGVGAKHYIGPMMWAMFRMEFADASPPSEAQPTKMGGLNGFWAVLGIGI